MLRTLFVVLLGLAACVSTPPQPAAQYPSPMVEHARAHERIPRPDTLRPAFTLSGVLDRDVPVFVGSAVDSGADVLIHFHGAAFVPAFLAQSADFPVVVAAVHLGAGSSVYERAFTDPGTFDALMTQIAELVAAQGIRLSSIHLSAFSAGYGAVRALLRDPETRARIDGVLLLDGLHTDYVPSRLPLAEGGRLNAAKMEPFLAYARRAVAGEAAFVITHSAVFPGTYASTTETADDLLDALGLDRSPVLRWGPVGMQHVSEAGRGRLQVLGFAGNTAPDHVDHLHGLPAFYRLLREMTEYE